ncbi:sensor histidine kinase [Nonomuraea terrae]|uniref:sensor histidine kinase n=1 Tax=Nonomuraea terrae TaxID=2530383 RepID=UPI0037880F3E
MIVALLRSRVTATCVLPQSIQARCTLMVSAAVLVCLALTGVCLAMAIRQVAEAALYDDIEAVAARWAGEAREGRLGGPPGTIPVTTRVDHIQIVDAHGLVLAASRTVVGLPPLTGLRPAVRDRVRETTARRPDGRPLLLTAVRVSPGAGSRYVYAGLAEPPVLAGHRLELVMAALAVPILLLAPRAITSVVGCTLHPVEAIRARMREIGGRTLNLRVPVPPGDDEIARLARAINEMLARVECAVIQQRRFAYDAAHELRGPIAGLRAVLEDALAEPGAGDPTLTYRRALSSADRLEAIVDDLLVLAQLRKGDPAPPEQVDLGALAGQVAAARPSRPPIRVGVPPCAWVRGSRVQLARVVENLLANAQRHARSRVELVVANADGHTMLSVTDDGIGIAPQDRERVFERFTRLPDARRRDPSGSGLGLAISREIAEAHRGTLRVEDSPVGARFVLRLPGAVAAPCRNARRRSEAC